MTKATQTTADPATDAVASTPELVKATYEQMEANLAIVRERLGRPLTLAEKVLFGHLDDPQGQELDRAKAYLNVRPDRVALQDATAQMALLQFISAGMPKTAVPTTVHCDHLIQARDGADPDLTRALSENNEVYRFLESASKKYGAGFWKPGSGIIHQVVLENYAFPGGLMIGTDSHTPNAGGLGMFASGVGGADAVDVMAGFPWEVLHPKVIGVKLTGKLNGWTAPKDVILKLAGILTVKGATNAVVEYFGEGAAAISCTGKGTITNMGAEIGATTSIFPYDDRMETYLRATNRAALAELANEYRQLLTADVEVAENPQDYFDEVIEIDLTTLEPHLVGPHTPDLARPIGDVAAAVDDEGYPERISAALVGSCTNSSYEDISRAADVAQQAVDNGAKVKTPLLVTPGSEQIRQTIERDGQMATLQAIGAQVLANACGPCIGQWSRPELKKGEQNAIVTSFNRNFPKRNDGNANTLAFIGSPELSIAFALSGSLKFNPLTDELEGPNGPFKLTAPKPAPEIPETGFVRDLTGYEAPAEDGSAIEVTVAEDSERLQLLEPFPAWDGKDKTDLPVLVKATGKCTTDHISPAGPWLRFRGHLDNISDNMFSGAINAFTGEAGKGKNVLTGETGVEFAKIARHYKAEGLEWVAVGDENYGEGSSREHAAMEPRHLRCAAVLARSFARIAETNLKKQGVLPLHFVDPADYEKIGEETRVSIVGLDGLAPGERIKVVLKQPDGSEDEIRTRHSLNSEQVAWFKAGSALNIIRQKA